MSNIKEKREEKEEDYGDYWQGWGHYLGYEVTDWNVDKVKELLRGLIESGEIKEWANDEAILYSILETKGLNNLSSNKHRNFFKNLQEVMHVQKALDEIKEYINSDSKTPPDLSKYTGTYYEELEEGKEIEEDEEIQEANAQELEDLLQREPTDPLDYGDIPAPKEILDKIGKTESISPDEEVMRLLVNHSIGKLWRGILRLVESSGLNSKHVKGFLNTIIKNGNKWRDEVVDTFLEDYNGTIYILDHLPKNYSYQYKPKLMQAYVAHKVLRNRYFMNLSGVGAGKTLSAILASRIINSKFTVIVCPNDIVGQWKATITKVFPDSLVYTSADPMDLEGGLSRKAFSVKRKESTYQYVVTNYEKFSLADSRQLILDLTNQKIDFVILDEIHFAKKRGDDNPRYTRMISQRNTNLNLFRSEVKT
jgi:hypothetical protein